MSVITNTTGHIITPAVKLKPRPSTPNSVMFNGAQSQEFLLSEKDLDTDELSNQGIGDKEAHQESGIVYASCS